MFSLAGIIVAIAYEDGMLGRNEFDRSIEIGPLCWVIFEKQHLQKSIIYMLITGKVWELACYLLTSTFYVLLKFKLYLRHRFKHLNEINPDLRADDRNFLYVWLVLLAIRAWGTIRFFMLIASKGEIPKTLEVIDTSLSYIQAFFDPSQALLNFILFCLLDRDVRQMMCQRCITKDYVRMRNNDVNNDVTQQQRIVNASFYEESYADNDHEVQNLISRSNEQTGVLSKIDTSYNGTGSKRKYGSVKTRESSFSNKSFTV
ncbi:hypothetical protein DPMN_125886 [Dreissena polymorpha]|uniref:Uncharacterized protein n=1 Tax=Dreissena polymorpha TaxID=45954 RepID=A0A9D4JXL7_DREPO|nr:hypothetical protein DPMN_125886 [Dreissena polymorpha]